eukprot:TRINITY_DN400_c0_g1_i1.p1 TRINITY_DN400_c0_g1~~TRINITY_DN400_c0_g1_i1.p1  ORF type:complete len:413 (-),score=91.94 TRINITY_DN400_c0_g1_i1:15-1253(-)
MSDEITIQYEDYANFGKLLENLGQLMPDEDNSRLLQNNYSKLFSNPPLDTFNEIVSTEDRINRENFLQILLWPQPNDMKYFCEILESKNNILQYFLGQLYLRYIECIPLIVSFINFNGLSCLIKLLSHENVFICSQALSLLNNWINYTIDDASKWIDVGQLNFCVILCRFADDPFPNASMLAAQTLHRYLFICYEVFGNDMRLSFQLAELLRKWIALIPCPPREILEDILNKYKIKTPPVVDSHQQIEKDSEKVNCCVKSTSKNGKKENVDQNAWKRFKDEGNQLLLNKELDKALEKYIFALQYAYNPESLSTLHSNISHCYYLLENYEKSLEHALKLKEINPEHDKVHVRLINSFLALKNLQDAQKCLQEIKDPKIFKFLNKKYQTTAIEIKRQSVIGSYWDVMNKKKGKK